MKDLDELLHVVTCIAWDVLIARGHFSGLFTDSDSTEGQHALSFIWCTNFFLIITNTYFKSFFMHLVTDLLLLSLTSLLDVLQFPTLFSDTSDTLTSPISTPTADLWLFVHLNYVLRDNMKKLLHQSHSTWSWLLSSRPPFTHTVDAPWLPLLSIRFSSISLKPFHR